MADRVVGLPIAMLCVYAQIASVYASVARKAAPAMLRAQGMNVATESNGGLPLMAGSRISGC